MDKARILLVEDSPDLARLVERGLGEEGFEVIVAPNAEEAFRRLQEHVDLILLDLMLPDASGETILSFLAQRNERPLVLVLSARSELEDKIALFRLGCDDYLSKPFAFAELVGRVKALRRRSFRVAADALAYEGLRLDAVTHEAQREGQHVPLTPKEFAILKLLLAEPGRVVPRAELLRAVWGLVNEPKTNFVEVHLANLRRKLGLLGCEPWLRTIRAAGITLSKAPDHGP